jgi:hypothetical protein
MIALEEYRQQEELKCQDQPTSEASENYKWFYSSSEQVVQLLPD